MTAVSAPPLTSAATAINAIQASGNNPAAAGLAGDSGAPADFASMLLALQALTAELIPTLPTDKPTLDADIAMALKELKGKTGTSGESGEQNPLIDIAGILGQIHAQNHPHPLVPALTQGAERHADRLPDLSADRTPGTLPKGLEMALSNAQGKPADAAPPLLRREAAETVEAFILPDHTIERPSPNPLSAAQEHRSHPDKVKLDIPTPVQSPNWSSEVGTRVVWMARNNIQEAQLSVNPPHLGPIEITLSLKDDNASARFFSPHAEVREILEQALPRLREMLAGAGVQLGQSDVGAQSQQAFQQFNNRTGHGDSNQPAFDDQHPSLHALDAVKSTVVARTLNGNGLVDTFV